MTHALHLKYRPQTLAELAGQPLIQTALTNAICQQQIAPAYLFAGPRGTGKTSTARIFAKSLNCLESKRPTANPCGHCQSCQSIDRGSSLDVSEIDAASHNGVDDARQLIEHSNFAPTISRYRLFILDEVHCLSNQAFNALLKVIEEPPPRVAFILCTTEAHKVLATVDSRCQTFNFRALSLTTMIGHLRSVAEAEAIDIREEALSAICRIANGGLRDALQLLSQLGLLGERIVPAHVVEASGGIHPEELAGLLGYLTTAQPIEVLQAARHLIDSGKTPQLILSSLLACYRDLLLVKSTPKCQQLIAGTVSYRTLRQLANGLDFAAIAQAFTQLQKAESQLKASLNGVTWLEVCLLNLMPDRNLFPRQRQDNLNGSQAAEASVSKRKPDLTALWAAVVEKAKPVNRELLSRATLTALKGSRAVLTVEAKYAGKFSRNPQTLERLLGKVLGRSVTVVIKSL